MKRRGVDDPLQPKIDTFCKRRPQQSDDTNRGRVTVNNDDMERKQNDYVDVKISDFGIHETWMPFFVKEYSESYFQDILKYLDKRQRNGKEIIPTDIKNIFNWTRLVNVENVKVIALGSWPYCKVTNPGSGVAFQCSSKETSSMLHMKKSLYRHENSRRGFTKDNNFTTTPFNFKKYIRRGSLFLNYYSITSEIGENNTIHASLGWSTFIENLIKYVISRNCGVIIFILMGEGVSSVEGVLNYIVNEESEKRERNSLTSLHWRIIKTTDPSRKDFTNENAFGLCDVYLKNFNRMPVFHNQRT